MEDIICVTNRHLAQKDYYETISDIASARPKAIILREKDLGYEEYEALAKKVITICEKQEVPLVLHYYVKAAVSLSVDRIHVPLPVLKQLSMPQKKHFSVLGTSVHSIVEAKQAQELGATYLAAGHIYETECKKGMPARGLEFLKQVCDAVDIPVYAIGGVTKERVRECKDVGAKGAMMMSGCMRE